MDDNSIPLSRSVTANSSTAVLKHSAATANLRCSTLRSANQRTARAVTIIRASDIWIRCQSNASTSTIANRSKQAKTELAFARCAVRQQSYPNWHLINERPLSGTGGHSPTSPDSELPLPSRCSVPLGDRRIGSEPSGDIGRGISIESAIELLGDVADVRRSEDIVQFPEGVIGRQRL